MNNQRNSSLELLRIICMLLIIAHHYSVHGGYGEFTIDNLTLNGVYVQILSMFGRLACSIFVLISGFYLIDASKGKHYRRIVPLIAEMFFYSVLIICLTCCFDLVPVGLGGIIQSFFPMFCGNWFVVSYLVFYMFVPFINPLLRSLTKKSYCILIITIIIIWSIIPTFFLWCGFGFGSVDFFIVFYIIGAYIKLHCQDVKYDNKYNLLIGLGCAFLIILSVPTIDLCGILTHKNLFLSYATCFKEYSTVLAVPCAIFIFLYFSRKTFYSKFVNTVGKSTLGIYLVHDNNYIRPYLWTVLFPNPLYIGNAVIHSIVKILSVFIICSAFDILRARTIGKLFDNWFYKHCDSMVDWIKAHTPKVIANLIY